MIILKAQRCIKRESGRSEKEESLHSLYSTLSSRKLSTEEEDKVLEIQSSDGFTSALRYYLELYKDENSSAHHAWWGSRNKDILRWIWKHLATEYKVKLERIQ